MGPKRPAPDGPISRMIASHERRLMNDVVFTLSHPDADCGLK